MIQRGKEKRGAGHRGGLEQRGAGHLLNEESQGGEDVSEGAGGLVDLEEEQVRVEHLLHQRVLPFLMPQLLLLGEGTSDDTDKHRHTHTHTQA